MIKKKYVKESIGQPKFEEMVVERKSSVSLSFNLTMIVIGFCCCQDVKKYICMHLVSKGAE